MEIHAEKHQDLGQKGARRTLPLSLPAYPSSDSLSSVSLLEGTTISLEPPAPAPASPPRTWGQHAIPSCTLTTQSRNGSDASFKVIITKFSLLYRIKFYIERENFYFSQVRVQSRIVYHLRMKMLERSSRTEDKLAVDHTLLTLEGEICH